MYVSVLLSAVGFVLANRTLSLLENFRLISASHSRKLHFGVLTVLLICLFFKEPITVNILFIGIFSIILILSPQIIRLLRQKTFEKLHLSLLQQILMSILSGHSPKTAVKSAQQSLNSFELSCVEQLNHVFDDENANFIQINEFTVTFFAELKQILNSETQIVRQLTRFRQYLILKNNLVHRSRQIRMQVYMQAAVCSLLYIFIVSISVAFLNLHIGDHVLHVSLLMMLSGLCAVFGVGRGSRWKT